jgi:hypothetical protein
MASEVLASGKALTTLENMVVISNSNSNSDSKAMA